MDPHDPARQRSAGARLRRARRRRWAAGLLLVLVAAVPARALLAGAADGPPGGGGPARGELELTAIGRQLTLPVQAYRQGPGSAQDRLERLLSRRLPAGGVIRRGRARIVLRYDLPATARRAIALGPGGGRLTVSRRAVSSRVEAPVIAQRLRNNCETAALAIVLAAEGTAVDQLVLQDQLSTSGPPDPVDGPGGRVWGDPDEGFVGRADGGGTAGGFGVYPGPLRALARRHGLAMEDLSGSSPASVYARLLTGAPVIAWVGLSDGPYASWTSPRGKPIDVNLGEHTVVLTGVDSDGTLRVNNPLEGTRESWSPAKFEAMWALLGRRALAARASPGAR